MQFVSIIVDSITHQEDYDLETGYPFKDLCIYKWNKKVITTMWTHIWQKLNSVWFHSVKETNNYIYKQEEKLINSVSQSYDGANVMSGHLTGVQTIIQRHYEYAFYIHCYACLLYTSRCV